MLVLIYADFDEGAKSLWPVFGATNQVLAAFTLLLCALYLRTLGRRTAAYAIPAVLVMAIIGQYLTGTSALSLTGSVSLLSAVAVLSR